MPNGDEKKVRPERFGYTPTDKLVVIEGSDPEKLRNLGIEPIDAEAPSREVPDTHRS